jgi:pimeloyl-ACP methyl ester carboxylesterase
MHTTEAKMVADLVQQLARENPHAKLTVSVHSGGAGIIVWALEQLPDDVKIDSLLLLSPALSPQYDLSKALRHVRGKVYAFYSPYDVAILGIGTHMFGTIDGVKTDAAGKTGFAKPAGADDAQYAKLVQVPYDSSWVRVGNIGDHIGTLSRPFARRVVAPLLLTGNLPQITSESLKTPATLPTGAPPTPPGATTMPAIPTAAQ